MTPFFSIGKTWEYGESCTTINVNAVLLGLVASGNDYLSSLSPWLIRASRDDIVMSTVDQM